MSTKASILPIPNENADISPNHLEDSGQPRKQDKKDQPVVRVPAKFSSFQAAINRPAGNRWRHD